MQIKLQVKEVSAKFIILLGDGFIFLYYPFKKDSLLKFCDNLIKYVNENLQRILLENDIKPKRVGITIGIDKGTLTLMRLYGSKEYMGEAINVAARLQSSLKGPEDTNTILVSEKVYEDIRPNLGDRKVRQQRQVLRNLFNDKEVDCYQIF